MKRNFLIGLSLFLLLGACHQAELDQSKKENDSLRALLNQRDTSVSYYMSSFNEIERNLDSVTARQQVIATNAEKTGGDMQQNQKDKINTEITAINNLMDENRKKIADLNRKMKGSAKKNAELQKAIDELNTRLTEKENELTALNEKLNSLNTQVTQLQTNVGTLTADTTAKAQDIAQKTMELHTAYYVIGKAKELQEANVIDRKGGLLGIGKTAELSPNFDNSKFTRIDYTKTGTIPINADDVKIITTHPADSYTLEKEDPKKDHVKNIIITNPDKFWSASKYLVVVKD